MTNQNTDLEEINTQLHPPTSRIPCHLLPPLFHTLLLTYRTFGHCLSIFFTLLPLVLLLHPFKRFFLISPTELIVSTQDPAMWSALYASFPDCLGGFDSSYSCGSLLLTFSNVMNFCGLPVSMSRLWAPWGQGVDLVLLEASPPESNMFPKWVSRM